MTHHPFTKAMLNYDKYKFTPFYLHYSVFFYLVKIGELYQDLDYPL